MPLYEYMCLDCSSHFDALRSMKDADSPISCEHCESQNTSRVISVFYAQSGGRIVAGSGNSGCAGCQSGSCAGCSPN